MRCRLGCHAMHHAPLPPQSCSLAAVSAAMVSLLTGRRPPLAGEVTGVARPLRKWSSLPVREGMRGWGRGDAWEQERVRVGSGCASSTRASTTPHNRLQLRTTHHYPPPPADASMRPRNRGEGLKGRDLNSGWNCRWRQAGWEGGRQVNYVQRW